MDHTKNFNYYEDEFPREREDGHKIDGNVNEIFQTIFETTKVLCPNQEMPDAAEMTRKQAQ